MPEQEAKAASVIDSARVLGGRRVTGHWEKVRPGQGGRRIVEEAREIKARALIMALPKRPRAGGPPLGRTMETVLADRPCRVIITTEPAKRPSESLAASA
jgi:APA family basic amino acid/polyamine antiporter